MFVACGLDYCNSLYFAVDQSLLRRLQPFQNAGSGAFCLGRDNAIISHLFWLLLAGFPSLSASTLDSTFFFQNNNKTNFANGLPDTTALCVPKPKCSCHSDTINTLYTMLDAERFDPLLKTHATRAWRVCHTRINCVLILSAFAILCFPLKAQYGRFCGPYWTKRHITNFVLFVLICFLMCCLNL